MGLTALEARVVAAWKEAAADLGIRFTSPFVITTSEGHRQAHLGLVHSFGHRGGTVISVLHEPSEYSARPPSNEHYWSVLGPPYAGYNRQTFMDTLNDWQFFGEMGECPLWYAGQSWS